MNRNEHLPTEQPIDKADKQNCILYQPCVLRLHYDINIASVEGHAEDL